MTYIAYPAAGHFDEGLSYLDFLWDRRDVFTAFARDFYEYPGLACPGVMSLAGQPFGGWGMFQACSTMSAWSAHLFYLHWRYTMDNTFLRQRAWPWSRDVGLCMKALLRTNNYGHLVLPLSSSPEIFDNSPRAFLKPNSNYDLMSLRMLFLALAEMADAQALGDEARDWTELSNRLGPYHARPDSTLKISEDEDLPASHRHLSNLMAYHPFNLINIDTPSPDLRTLNPTLDEWDRMGPSQWCGYSYSWMSALRARVGRPEEALRLLDIFVKAFVLRNGFHANGDQTKSGYSSMTYRPFTLEGNFLAMHAIHEMLLQSWSPTPGRRNTEVVRIFPAAPWRWHDTSFTNLRAEGGYSVSARRRTTPPPGSADPRPPAAARCASAITSAAAPPAWSRRTSAATDPTSKSNSKPATASKPPCPSSTPFPTARMAFASISHWGQPLTIDIPACGRVMVGPCHEGYGLSLPGRSIM